MEEKLTATREELKEVVKEALEDVGLIDPYIGRSEIVRIINRHRYDKAIKAGILHRERKGAGKNSKVGILRTEFVRLLKEGKI